MRIPYSRVNSVSCFTFLRPLLRLRTQRFSSRACSWCRRDSRRSAVVQAKNAVTGDRKRTGDSGRPERFGRRQIRRSDQSGRWGKSGKWQRLCSCCCAAPQARGLEGSSPDVEACQATPSQNPPRGLSIAQWVNFLERRWVNHSERQGRRRMFPTSVPLLNIEDELSCARSSTGVLYSTQVRTPPDSVSTSKFSAYS